MVPIRVFQSQTLDEMGCAQSFLRRIAVLLKPEAVARLGSKWYAATDKGSLASMLRGIVIASNFEGFGEIYDKMGAESGRRAKTRNSHYSQLHAHQTACRPTKPQKRWAACRPIVCPDNRSGNGA